MATGDPASGTPLKVSALLLAAGRGSRMGGAVKALLPAGRKTFLDRCLDALAASSVSEIVVVLGFRAGEVLKALAGRPLPPGKGFKVVVNPGYEGGQSASLRAGLETVAEDAAGVLCALVDQPLVPAGTVERLLARYRDGRPVAVVPVCCGRRGNPVILDRVLWPEVLATATGDTGARAVLEKRAGEVATVDGGPEVLQDVDDWDDYRRLLAAVGPADAAGGERPAGKSSFLSGPAGAAAGTAAATGEGTAPRPAGGREAVPAQVSRLSPTADGMCRLPLVVIRGAGDLATGVAHRLCRSGFPVVMTEVEKPTAIRRTVAFAEAVYEGAVEVEGVVARCAADGREALALVGRGEVPVVVDAGGRLIKELRPHIVVDAIMAKRNLGTAINDAPVVVALGPGFEAGVDVHAVVETNRGHNLGRVITSGRAEPNTGVPGIVGGFGAERVLRAPAAGRFAGERVIGDRVDAGETVAWVTDGGLSHPVRAAISGILRGILWDGLPVTAGMKVGDVDPRAAREHCFTISDKARAVAGGVLEAIMMLLRRDPGYAGYH